MWFILLFALCGLAIPIALEIHARGRDNILARSTQDLARSRLGKLLSELLGQTYGWLQSLVALVLVFLFVWGILRLGSWLLGLIF